MTTTHNPLILHGGAERDRTVGLLNAIQALSQLSYVPNQFFARCAVMLPPAPMIVKSGVCSLLLLQKQLAKNGFTVTCGVIKLTAV